MIEISLDKERIIKGLKELENEYNKGNLSKNQYNFQKRKLTQQLETFEVANRVRKLQGKETKEVANKNIDEEKENGELFKKFITPTGLKEKNIKSKGTSINTKILAAVLIAAFFVGFASIYAFNIPQQVSSSPLFTNDTAFPPYIPNATNTTNNTNVTKTVVKNTTVKPTNSTVTKIPTTTINTSPTTNLTPHAAGSPTTTKDYYNSYYYDPTSDYANW